MVVQTQVDIEKILNEDIQNEPYSFSFMAKEVLARKKIFRQLEVKKFKEERKLVLILEIARTNNPKFVVVNNTFGRFVKLLSTQNFCGNGNIFNIWDIGVLFMIFEEV